MSQIEDLCKDLRTLAISCNTANWYLRLDTAKTEIKLVDYYVQPKGNLNWSGDVNFHPDGRTGCVCLNDDYLFGIRCNHLIWITGTCEYSPCEDGRISSIIIHEYTTDEEYELLNNLPSDILLIGNHKGELCSVLLTCYYKPEYLESIIHNKN